MVSIEAFSSFSKGRALDSVTSSIVLGLRDARERTLSSAGGSQYGVRVESDRYTLFQGPSFSPEAPSNRVFLTGSLARASSSLDSFVFERLTGNSSASGTIDVYLASDPATKKTIRVQGTGLVDTQ